MTPNRPVIWISTASSFGSPVFLVDEEKRVRRVLRKKDRFGFASVQVAQIGILGDIHLANLDPM
jgi:hypothetical protein